MLDKLLLLLPLGIIIGLPGYIFFRGGMVKSKKRVESCTKKRVFKLTGVNLILNSLVTIYFLILFLILTSNIDLYTNYTDMCLAILFMMTIGITFYGNGIYVTSIVLEDYTLPDLRSTSEFKTQFIATHLFHGSISHILIYSGWLLIFLTLALLDLSGIASPGLNTQNVLIIGGAIVGIVYALAQIYNGTSPYQFLIGLGVLTIFLGKLLTTINFTYRPVAIFFAATIIHFEIVLFLYFIYLWVRKRKINWDGSGY